MDVNLKNEIEFEKFYQNEYINAISYYYENLKGKRISTIAFRLLFTAILSAISGILINTLNLKEILNDYYNTVIYIYYILVTIATIFSIKKALAKIMYKLNEDIMRDLFAFISNNGLENVMYDPKKMLSEEALEKMELFNLDVVKYRGKNYIKVPYNKNNMVFSDIKTYIIDIIETKKEIYKDGKKYIRTIRKKKKRNIFDGLYIGATLNKKNTNHIYLIPNNFNDTFLQSKIMNYIKYQGTPVMLENLEFSKKYKVFCDDEVQARYILSLSLMERINKLDELYKGKKYIVFKEGKRFAICIEGLSIENIKKIKLPAFRNQNKEINVLTNIFTKLNDLFKIYYILDLGNDLYTKYIDKPLRDVNTTKSNVNAFIQPENETRKVVLSNREKLLKTMKIQDNIRQLSQEDINKILKKTMFNVNNVIHNIQLEQSAYSFSGRQIATRNNAINNIKSKHFLDAYYEIMDFAEDYGDKHNGLVYEKEKQEIISLMQMLEKSMKEQPISKDEFLNSRYN